MNVLESRDGLVDELFERCSSYGLRRRVVRSSITGTAHTTTAAGSHGRDETSPMSAMASDAMVATTAIVVALRVHTK